VGVGAGRDARPVDDNVPEWLAGVVTTAEMASAGLSPARIRTLVGRRALVPVWRGVYARAAMAAALATQPGGEHALHVAAAVAVTGRGAAGSHHSAALVHRLDLLDEIPPGITTVTRPRDVPGSRSARLGIRLHMACACPVLAGRQAPGGGVRGGSLRLGRDRPRASPGGCLGPGGVPARPPEDGELRPDAVRVSRTG
jgi:hypothetical protein